MLNRKFEHPSADLEERIIASSFYAVSYTHLTLPTNSRV